MAELEATGHSSVIEVSQDLPGRLSLRAEPSESGRATVSSRATSRASFSTFFPRLSPSHSVTISPPNLNFSPTITQHLC